MIRLIFLFVACSVLSACSDSVDELPKETLPSGLTTSVSYHDAIRPIIEKKCIACHSCFDAPCQLKLESAAGLIRGATLKDAYDGGRKNAIAPTRLDMDGYTEQDWRNLNFYSVIHNANNKPTLLKVLELGQTRKYSANAKLPDSLDLSLKRANQCAVSDEFLADEDNAHLVAMPFAVSGLDEFEFSTIAGWIKQGATIDDDKFSLTDDEQQLIIAWETYLNKSSLKSKLVARWLYEHLYLAHLYLSKDSANRYFQLVRSYTPTGKPIEIVSTRLPNNNVDKPFFYRLRYVNESTVHKRHISLIFDEHFLHRTDEIFYEESWDIDKLPGYGYSERANPFETFSAIPAKARYQFMLENSEYFVRSFIRGPVCRGQIATDVIRDRFWVMFQKPDHDLFVTDPEHRKRVIKHLGLPGQNDNLLEANENWDSYKDKRNSYLNIRSDDYRRQLPESASLASVWTGNDNALLTVFRHFDSASVRRGLIGATPTTIWWIDFPLFERIYYELVVNFDLFGNVAHQLQTRLYFDLLRNGAEHNFLRLIPADQRKALLDEWYGGLSLIKTHITYAPLDEQSKSFETFSTSNPKSELGQRMLNQFSGINDMAEDPINRCTKVPCFRQDLKDWLKPVDQKLSALTSTPFSQLNGGLKYLPELSFLRVTNDDERTVYSMIRNRSHSNVAFMFGESLRYKPKQDTLTIYPGIAGSYPNFIFDVKAQEMDLFISRLLNVESVREFDSITERWGIRRTHPQFWDVLRDITLWQKESEPLQAGIFDVNRYKNL